MKFTSVFLLSLAGFAMAKKNSSSTSTKSQCKEMAKLTALVELASNTTALEAKAKNNETKVAAIEAQASAAATKLATLESNSTLVTVCSQISAVETMDDNCDKIATYEALVALAANTTALDSKSKNNATKAAAIQAKASTAATKLATLSSNTTLTQYCAVQNDLAQCKIMSKLQKTVDKGSNTTALEAKYGSSSEKLASAQAKVSEATTQLATLTSNSTLVDFCSASGVDVAEAAASSSATATSTASTTSSANQVRSSWSMGAVSALFAAVLATVYMI